MSFYQLLSISKEEATVPILEAKGYTVTAVDMSDLLTAGIALNDSGMDFNVEQHTAYIESINSANNGDLVGISPIPTVPAGVYSSRHSSVDEIANGATVAVPNDASNMDRCYLMLQIVDACHSDEFKTYLAENNDGLWWIPAELQ